MFEFARPLLFVAAALAVIGVLGFVVFLATWDMKPPTQRIEKVIPNERLAR